MTRSQELTAKRARAVIEQLRRGAPWGFMARATLLEEAVSLAREVGQPLLEAQAVLARYRFRAPFASAAAVLRDLQRAESIFLAHDDALSAARCRVEQASALADLGQETLAIQQAQNCLHGPNLHADDQLHIHLTIAGCHLHTGDIDGSWRQLHAQAQPLAALDVQAGLRARLSWQKGMTLMARLMARHQADLWLRYVGLPEGHRHAGSLSEALSLMDEAQRLLPVGHPSGHLRLARYGGLALLGDDEHAPAELERLAEETGRDDPALAVRVMFTRGLLLHRQGRPEGALSMLDGALAMATAWEQRAMARHIALHQSQIHEALGDTTASLKALKTHAHLLTFSLREPASTPLAKDRLSAIGTPTGAPASGAGGEHGATSGAEPAYLAAADRFVAQQAGRPIRVSDIVAHCGVSRRTLETSLRRFRSISVRELIVAHQMAWAAHALQHTRHSVVDIALDAGYRSAPAFAQEFKRRFGAVPSHWRKRHPVDGSA